MDKESSFLLINLVKFFGNKKTQRLHAGAPYETSNIRKVFFITLLEFLLSLLTNF
jgi:hypothetical protein